MKRMKKVTVATLCFSVALFAAGGDKNESKGNESFNYILKTRTEAGKLSTRVTIDQIDEGVPQQKDTYLDSVIFNDIKRFSGQPRVSKAVKVAFTNDNIGDYMRSVSNAAKAAEKRNEANNMPKYYRAKGFCSFPNEVGVTASSEFSLLRCNFALSDAKGENVGFKRGKLFVGLYPNYKKETLVALPIYIEFGSAQYPAVGVAMNAAMTSLNVATYVDNVRIRKLLAKSLLVGSDVAYKQATAYLAALEKSKEINQVTYTQQQNPNGTITNVPVVVTNTRRPYKEDYWAVGMVELAASLVDLFGKDYLEYLTPLFKVSENTTVWVDTVFKTNAQRDVESRFRTINMRLMNEATSDNARWNAEKMQVGANLNIRRRESGIDLGGNQQGAR